MNIKKPMKYLHFPVKMEVLVRHIKKSVIFLFK